ncbi:MAG: VWA domain-containing protein [Leptolyngbyaceae cyanobacterium]|uniref:vWA domain-containing protein n=1 Tax=Leptodesmis sichuanensis TaxID=2906798 RepID=UPI001F4165AE|nr:VWA domain-containing protein [Leptodesmis sichuanensis]UIE36368.1 VWA domain-containing protein [Leptodesmis sichuanensis A121]
MKVGLQFALSDASVDATQAINQRQLSVSVSAIADETHRSVPLNLCLILDHSGSMSGHPMDMVREAAQRLMDRLSLGDRISIIGFNHKAKVLVPNQELENPISIKLQIDQLQASGGTAIDEGLRLGIEELAKAKQGTISQIFLLTDGENEHGDNDRCLKLAKLAADYNLTLSTLGFGSEWNQDILEKIADTGRGTMSYIQQPEDAVAEFGRMLSRMQTVGLTNGYLLLSLMPGVRLAEMKPIAQVAPDAIELPVQQEGTQYVVRLGDLMVEVPRVVLVNLYLNQMAVGQQAIARIQARYDDPASQQEGLSTDSLTVYADYVSNYQPNPDPQVQRHILALAKYRQTQIAENKLQQGDLAGAATMLQTAANTALQMGDEGAATVLQDNATRLQQGETLSESDRKKTRMVSKTTLQ